MMNFNDYRIGERIYEGSNSDVFIADHIESGQRRVIKIARTGDHSARKIAMIRHEFALTQTLEIPGIVKPLEIRSSAEGAALIMEFAGDSWAGLLAQGPLPLADVLRGAIQVVDTLGAIHAANIIHKDIKPANLVVDSVTGDVKITDFSISTELRGERTAVRDFRALEGTLQYISPEQTGRMNRTIDHRTDYYSFGATLYHLVSGAPLFETADPMELVHCHMARVPKALEQGPACLNALVMKLLAKTAEERYQTAASLQADLETCLQAVESGDEPEDFVPGTGDHPDTLQISQRLYGRESDVATLMAAFDRVGAVEDAEGDTELLLVAGYSGIGKSAIVNEVHRPIVGRQGYFIAGKFDQFNRNIPYASMILAFQSLVSQLLTETGEELATWRQKLTDALGANGQVIVDVIPEVELIIGPQAAVGELGLAETKNRFNHTFGSFIRVFATAERPLVLFLDDLQWADAGSLNLISLILGDAGIKHLLMIGAYRDNEVDPSHPLMLMLRELGEAKSRVSTITLQPLEETHVGELIADSLQTSAERCADLTALVTDKTRGNPFFVIQLLTNIHQQGLLRFDRQSGEWAWDMAALQALDITDNVVDLMVGKVNGLAPETRAMLEFAACMGNRFDLAALARLAGATPQAAATDLWEAMEAGLVVPLNNEYKLTRISDDFDAAAIRFRFLHDRVQQASYAIIPEEQRGRIHLSLATQMRDALDADELDEHIFEIVSHLNLGADNVDGVQSRLDAARLNLRAARRARASTAYGPALACVQAAVGFLPEGTWESEYELTLDLYNELVDMHYLTLDFEGAESAAKVVTSKARNVIDTIRVYEIRIQYYVGQNRMLLAIDTVKEVLELLEVPLTDELPEDMQVAVLQGLPPMTDPRYLAAMRILMSSMPAVYIAAPEILPLVSFTMVRLTVRHGTSRMAAYAYSLYALIMAGVLGHHDVGFSFAQLALAELEKFKAVELESKVYALVYIFVHHWKRHLKDTLEPLLHGVQIGIDTGDVEYAGYNAVHYSTFYLFCGDELSSADARLETYIDLSRQLKQEYGYFYIRVWRQLVAGLRSAKVDHSFIAGDIFDEHTETEGVGAMLPVRCSLHSARTMLRYFYGDFEGAVESANQADELIAAVAGFVTPVLIKFYQALSLLGAGGDLAKVDENIEQLRIWAGAQPENNQHKLDLVLAERARVTGDHLAAMGMYQQAIAGARQHGFLHEEGLAYERAAQLYEEMNNEEIARHHRTLAFATYERWGAAGKCADMVEKYPALALGRTTRRARSGTLSTVSGTTTGGADLDLVSVVKASQALAGEIVHDRLVEKLMRIVIENVGAEVGYLILHRDEGLFVEARGQAATEEVQIDPAPLADSKQLGTSIVHYVERTAKSVVLEDAVDDPRFSVDPYVQANKPKSVLCAPIINKGRVIGLFYFENNLTHGVFTADRLEILGLLSSQVSISIENAKLYEQLEEHSRTLETKVVERTQELQQTNVELRDSLDQIQTMQKQIIVQEKLASLGTLTAGIAHELRNPLNFVNNFSNVQIDLAKELREVLDEGDLEEARELVGDFEDTSGKIHGHGQRAASIIDNMLRHANSSSAEREVCDLNDVVQSAVELAYHGVKAKDDDVTLDIAAEYDDAIGQVSISRAEISRVIINVVNNACYATSKKRAARGDDYTPQLSVRTTRANGNAEIRLRDNGVGIPPGVLEKVFNPFFTTKPPGEGTGLGLSLSHDIVVGGHQGELRVDTKDGEFAEFVIVLPA